MVWGHDVGEVSISVLLGVFITLDGSFKSHVFFFGLYLPYKISVLVFMIVSLFVRAKISLKLIIKSSFKAASQCTIKGLNNQIKCV